MGLTPYRLLPLEPFELDAVGFDSGVAQPALLVGLVVLEVAFEPLDVAVALEGEDVGRKLYDPAAKHRERRIYGCHGDIEAQRLRR